MKERFKRYLEREFRAISPTKAAMEYRKDMLRQMLDRSQELQIKGIDDEELIYDMVIDELGDFRQTLVDFDNREIKVKKAKRTALFSVVFSVAFAILLTSAYLITSFALGNAWGQTWLIMVGGIFAGVIAGIIALAVFAVKKKKPYLFRICMAIIEVLVAVFVFLVLQILTTLPMCWITFLVMVLVVLGIDTALSEMSNSIERQFELAIFIEVFCALLYVILGVSHLAPWHPTWLLCLFGALAIVVEILFVVASHNKKKNKSEKKKIKEQYIIEDEDYYTKWDD